MCGQVRVAAPGKHCVFAPWLMGLAGFEVSRGRSHGSWHERTQAASWLCEVLQGKTADLKGEAMFTLMLCICDKCSFC